MSTAKPRLRAGLKRRAAVFASLGDPIRLSLVLTLSAGPPQSISRLAEHAQITRQGLTRHLRTLEHAGVVHSTRIGRESVFAFRPEPLRELRTYLEQVSAEWDDALGRLKAFVER